MLTDDLFNRVLIAPAAEQGINRLRIVSGFATPNMAVRHMEQLSKCGAKIDIDLIIGMTRHAGIERARHVGFQKLASKGAYGLNINCRYVVKGNAVHAKTYCWLKDKQPILGFTGSANYSLTAFGKSQTENMTQDVAADTSNFYKKIKKQTEDCLLRNIESHLTLTEAKQFVAPSKRVSRANEQIDEAAGEVHLSLLTRAGETPNRSGINWGQRANRDQNQAYINIPAKIGKSGFFPSRYEQFAVLTDDDESFIMVRAQDDGKGLETTQNNALLGAYLRSRMGLPSGIYVTRAHLEAYGRTFVTFKKIDEETYLMDFRPIVESSH